VIVAFASWVFVSIAIFDRDDPKIFRVNQSQKEFQSLPVRNPAPRTGHNFGRGSSSRSAKPDQRKSVWDARRKSGAYTHPGTHG